jgi:hypothetical protein
VQTLDASQRTLEEQLRTASLGPGGDGAEIAALEVRLGRSRAADEEAKGIIDRKLGSIWAMSQAGG